MAVVADTAPLIFLSKINQLNLIPKLCGNEILVPAKVRAEVLGPRTPPDEERLLVKFMDRCSVVDVADPETFSKAMSLVDNCVLTLALDIKADLLIADDRLLRKIAIMEGLRVLGTLGILIGAVKRQLISPKQAHHFLQELIEGHCFRISTAVYEGALAAIQEDRL